MRELEHKVGLFADDVLIYLEQSDKCLPKLMNLLRYFGYLSDYNLNVGKTQVLPINFTPPPELTQKYNFKWNKKAVHYLGINISNNLSKLCKANYESLNHQLYKDMERGDVLLLDLSA